MDCPLAVFHKNMIKNKNTVHKISENKLNIQDPWLLFRVYERFNAILLA
jgi:hypothetical protein